MTTRTLKLLLIFSITINLGVIGAIGYRTLKHPIGRFKSPDERFKRAQGYMKKHLNLNSHQCQQLQQLWQEQWEIKRPYINKLSEHNKRLFDLIQAENPDREAIKNELIQINSIRSEINDKIIEHLFKQKGILTKEQRGKFFEMFMRQFGSDGGLGPGGRPEGRSDGGFNKNREFRDKGHFSKPNEKDKKINIKGGDEK